MIPPAENTFGKCYKHFQERAKGSIFGKAPRGMQLGSEGEAFLDK